MRRVKKLGSGAYGTVYLGENFDNSDSDSDDGYRAVKRNFKDSKIWLY